LVFRRATTIAAYIDLIREAEKRLIASGVTTVDERIQVLSGIYYGTDWSLDFEVMKDFGRDAGFWLFTGRAGQGADPRPILGKSLFEALKRSQDVADPKIGKVDIGHMIIGLNARSSLIARSVDIPGHGATGLELVTWVGDLGGAAAQLARARLSAPKTTANRFFSPAMRDDYGADSNLQGDVAAYVAGAASGVTSAPALVVPASGSIADALAAYFSPGPVGGPDRVQAFLQMLGGTFSGATLTNRPVVEQLMATKFRDFGTPYAISQFGLSVAFLIRPQLAQAGADIAKEFMNWLLARKSRPGPPKPHKR